MPSCPAKSGVCSTLGQKRCSTTCQGKRSLKANAPPSEQNCSSHDISYAVFCLKKKLPRQIRLPHQKLIDGPRAEAALADRPHHERLAAAHVAGGEHVRPRGVIVGH